MALQNAQERVDFQAGAGRYVQSGGTRFYLPEGVEVRRSLDARGNVNPGSILVFDGKRVTTTGSISAALAKAGYAGALEPSSGASIDPRTIERSPEAAKDYRAKMARRENPDRVVSRVIRDGQTRVRLKSDKTQVFENRTTPKDGYFIRQPNGDLVGFRTRAELRAFANREYGQKRADALLAKIDRGRVVEAPKVERGDSITFAKVKDEVVPDLSSDTAYTPGETLGDKALGFLGRRRRAEAEVAQAVRVAKQEGTFTNDLRVANVKATYSNVLTGAALPVVQFVTQPLKTTAEVGLEAVKFTGDVFAAIGGRPERLGRKIFDTGAAIVEQPVTAVSGIAGSLLLFEAGGAVVRSRTARTTQIEGINLLEANTRVDAAGSTSIVRGEVVVKVGSDEFLVNLLGKEVTGPGAAAEVSKSIFKFESRPAAGGEATRSIQVGRGQRVGGAGESVAVVEYDTFLPKGSQKFKDVQYVEPGFAFKPGEVGARSAKNPLIPADSVGGGSKAFDQALKPFFEYQTEAQTAKLGLNLEPNIFTGVRPKKVQRSSGQVKIVSEELGAVDGLAVTRFQTLGKEGGRLSVGEGIVKETLKVDDFTRSEAFGVELRGSQAKKTYTDRFSVPDDPAAGLLRNNPKNPLSADALAQRKSRAVFEENLGLAVEEVAKSKAAPKADVFGLALEGAKETAKASKLAQFDLQVAKARPAAGLPVLGAGIKAEAKPKEQPKPVASNAAPKAKAAQKSAGLGVISFTPIKIKSDDKTGPVEITGGGVRIRQGQKDKQRGAAKSDTGLDTGLEIEQKQEGRLDVSLKSGALQVPKRALRLPLSGGVPPFGPATPRVPKTPGLPAIGGRLKGKGAGVFSALVRRRGRFESIGSFSSAKDATQAAADFVQGSSAASFKIKQGSRSVRPTGGLLGFRRSKKDKDVFVELDELRINRPGELREITFKSRKARRFI